MVQADHLANIKRGDVCMYYKNYPSLKVLDIRFLLESAAFDLRIADNYVVSFQFTNHLTNFELTLDNLA